MKYSLTIAYAIQATVLVADQRSNTPISCGQIAHIGNMPERFLLRILSGLVAAKILKSTRGSDGGYTLARPPGKITLLEIIDAVTPSKRSDSPTSEGVVRGRQSAIDLQLTSAFTRATQAARREFERFTIADLMVPTGCLSRPV